MSWAAGALLAASLAAGPAAAEISLTAVRIAQGELWVIGQAQEPNAPVTLDERFEQTTDGRGRFEFRVVYHPATCIVTLRTPLEQRQAVVQGCGQTGPRGEAGAVGPQGPAGPPGPPGPRGTVETAEAPPAPPAQTAPAAPPQRPQAAPPPPAAPPLRPAETARLPDPVPAAPPAPPAPARPAPPPAPPAPPVLGEWLVEDGAARIAIQPCGSNVCGSISWSKEGGELGTQILRAMKPAGPNRWEGTIYDPTTGRSYSSNISLRSSDSLRVEGCVLGVLCGGQTWTRAR